MKHKKRIQLFEDFQAMPKEAPAPPKPKTVPDTRPDTRPREPKTPDPFRPVRPRIKPVPLNVSKEEEVITPTKPETVPDTRPDTRPREPKTPDPFRPVRPRIKPVPLNQIVDKFIDKYIELSKNDPESIEILSKYEK
jgi:hypothetical protein